MSKVGINQADPDYTLDINGDANVRGIFRINGAAQHLDTYGIVKSNPNVLDESITVPANTNAFMCGDITVANGRTVPLETVAPSLLSKYIKEKPPEKKWHRKLELTISLTWLVVVQ